MIMKDWQFTQEQAEAIKNGDISARNKFYTDNYQQIRRLAQSYCKKETHIRCRDLVEDMVNQVYLDLPYLRYDDKAYFNYTLYKSFYYVAFGGLSYLIENNMTGADRKSKDIIIHSLDAPMTEDENGLTLLDCLSYDEKPLEDMIRSDVDYIELLKPVFKKHMKPEHVEFLTLVLEGHSMSDARRQIGKTSHSSYSMSYLISKLIPHYEEIIDVLLNAGCEVVLPYLGIVPDGSKPKKVYKLSEEERKKRNAWQRAARERKRMSKQQAQAS